MSIFNKYLAVIFSFLFLYTYSYTESHARFVLIEKEASHSGNSDSSISQTCYLYTFPYNNSQEKTISSWKVACHWFTRLGPEASLVSSYQNSNKGVFRFLSRIIYLDEVCPNFTVRIKIFPFHYFL